jgi:hypothetical protein
MAIAPIDLQTIFSQVDKVARTQMAQREGQALQQAIQGTVLQRKTEEQINQVNEAQNTGEGADKINDNNQRQNSGKKNDGKKKDEKDNEEEDQFSVLSDPCLGKKIDISL